MSTLREAAQALAGSARELRGALMPAPGETVSGTFTLRMLARALTNIEAVEAALAALPSETAPSPSPSSAPRTDVIDRLLWVVSMYHGDDEHEALRTEFEAVLSAPAPASPQPAGANPDAECSHACEFCDNDGTVHTFWVCGACWNTKAFHPEARAASPQPAAPETPPADPGRALALEEAARVADHWAAQYPVDVFPEDSPSLDAKAAGHGRHVAREIAKDVRALAASPREDPPGALALVVSRSRQYPPGSEARIALELAARDIGEDLPLAPDALREALRDGMRRAARIVLTFGGWIPDRFKERIAGQIRYEAQFAEIDPLASRSSPQGERESALTEAARDLAAAADVIATRPLPVAEHEAWSNLGQARDRVLRALAASSPHYAESEAEGAHERALLGAIVASGLVPVVPDEDGKDGK